jgi:hypothetical protein
VEKWRGGKTVFVVEGAVGMAERRTDFQRHDGQVQVISVTLLGFALQDGVLAQVCRATKETVWARLEIMWRMDE